MLDWAKKRSISAFHLCGGGGCNGCDIEVVAAGGPRYDLEQLGVTFTKTPTQADLFIVTDAVTWKNKKAFIEAYQQATGPKAVVAIGNCAITGELFRGLYGIAGTPDRFIPVDVYIPGCPPRPHAIREGLKKAIKVLGGRR